jgi:hypothetical protein
MAQVKKKVLGTVHGAVGDMVFREKFGNSYVGMRPKSFVPGKDDASIARRKRFKMVVEFGRSVNVIKQLKYFWDVYGPQKMSPYNYIVKKNYLNVLPDDVSNTALLVPDLGFSITTPTINITNTRITVTVPALGLNTGIDTNIEKSIVLKAILFFKTPVDVNYKPFEFLSLESSSQTLTLTDPIVFNIPLSDYGTQIYDMYSARKGFFALVTTDINNKPIRFSNTENS